MTVAETEGKLQGFLRMFGDIDIEFHESDAKQITKLLLRRHHIIRRDHYAIHTPQSLLMSHTHKTANILNSDGKIIKYL